MAPEHVAKRPRCSDADIYLAQVQNSSDGYVFQGLCDGSNLRVGQSCGAQVQCVCRFTGRCFGQLLQQPWRRLLAVACRMTLDSGHESTQLSL